MKKELLSKDIVRMMSDSGAIFIGDEIFITDTELTPVVESFEGRWVLVTAIDYSPRGRKRYWGDDYYFCVESISGWRRP